MLRRKPASEFCRLCARPVRWVSCRLGQEWVPIDAWTWSDGDERFGVGKHMNHRATCPVMNPDLPRPRCVVCGDAAPHLNSRREGLFCDPCDMKRRAEKAVWTRAANAGAKKNI